MATSAGIEIEEDPVAKQEEKNRAIAAALADFGYDEDDADE